MSAAARWDCHVHVFAADAPVLPGHYCPREAPLDAVEALALAHGQTRLVLVQPSVYGTDNGVLLRALHQRPGLHRGVAVLDAGATDAQLQALHAAGVRGVRFNLVSPVGNQDADLQALAPRLRALGWHVQWYVPAAQLGRVARLQQDIGLPFVLDHLAGLQATSAEDASAWTALRRLAEGGAWLKLSGWYRQGAAAPYAALQPVLRRAAALFGTRLVWGSDWPHTAFAQREDCAYADLLRPLEALDAPARKAALEDGPATLYGGWG